MRTLTLLVATAALVALALASFGNAASRDQQIKLKATLTTGQETPAPKGTTGGSGQFNASLNTLTRNLSWRLSYSRLSGPASAAHIHAGKRGQAGPVMVPLCPPCLLAMTG